MSKLVKVRPASLQGIKKLKKKNKRKKNKQKRRVEALQKEIEEKKVLTELIKHSLTKKFNEEVQMKLNQKYNKGLQTLSEIMNEKYDKGFKKLNEVMNNKYDKGLKRVNEIVKEKRSKEVKNFKHKHKDEIDKLKKVKEDRKICKKELEQLQGLALGETTLDFQEDEQSKTKDPDYDEENDSAYYFDDSNYLE